MSIISWPRKHQVDKLYDAYPEFKSFSAQSKKAEIFLMREGKEC